MYGRGRRHHILTLLQVGDQESTNYRISSSISSNEHFGFMGAYSPGPSTAANKTYRAIDLSEEDGRMSTLDLEDGPCRSESFSMTATSSMTPPSGTSQQHPESPASLEAEIVGPVIVQHRGRHHHALLLTAEMYEVIQDITRIKRELHELDLSITELTEQANDLRVAKETLESHREHKVSGAFPKQGDGGETARRQLLIPAIRRRLGICERSLHGLDEQRQFMVAELDLQQLKFLGTLGQVEDIAR